MLKPLQVSKFFQNLNIPDITEGINEASCCNSGEGFSCSVGWDPVTGVGVPNFPKLLVAALSV